MKLKMGELSKMSGIAVNTIAYYEQAGLLAPSWRTSGRFRLYDDYLLDRLRFIRICRQQGLKHKDIKPLLDFRDGREDACPMTPEDLDLQIKKLDNEIHRLGLQKKELAGVKAALQCPKRRSCAAMREEGSDACMDCPEKAE